MQIAIAMAVGGAVSAWMCDSTVTTGAFTGALLAMSSTSVVVKCLEATRYGKVWVVCGNIAPHPHGHAVGNAYWQPGVEKLCRSVEKIWSGGQLFTSCFPYLHDRGKGVQA